MLTSKGLWTLTLGFMALHLALAANLPLVEDEAYYQLWATVPSWGYYDHPPMIAWWIAAGEALLGPSLLGVRLASVLASGVITFLVYRTAWLYSKDHKTAFIAALWMKAMLPFAVLGFVATPDAPSILFWTAAIWALSEVLTGGSRNWWLMVGLFAGLGVLSKFTNFFFGLSLVIWLLASKQGRGWLSVWQVWAGAALGVLVLLPFLWWNYLNGWVGFERQFGRLGVANNFVIGDILAFWASIVILLSPLVFWRLLRGLSSSRVPSVLIWISAPIVIYLGYHATKTSAGGQWLGPIFPTLAIIAALPMVKNWTTRWAAPTGMAIALLVLTVGFWPGVVLIKGHIPFTQVRGWPQTIARISALAKAENVTWIATDAYGLTGQLSHYLTPLGLTVRAVTEPERYLFEPKLPTAFCDAKALFISRKPFPEGVPYFANSKAGPDLTRQDGGVVLMRYSSTVVSGLIGCKK